MNHSNFPDDQNRSTIHSETIGWGKNEAISNLFLK